MIEITIRAIGLILAIGQLIAKFWSRWLSMFAILLLLGLKMELFLIDAIRRRIAKWSPKKSLSGLINGAWSSIKTLTWVLTVFLLVFAISLLMLAYFPELVSNHLPRVLEFLDKLAYFPEWLDRLLDKSLDMLMTQDLNRYVPLSEHESLSNIERNKYLLFFAIFASGLAIWARATSERNLKQIKKQIKNSLAISRNDRYAKAVEMLEGGKSLISNKSGLYILRDLIDEADETESIRYAEVFADWSKQYEDSPERTEIAIQIFG